MTASVRRNSLQAEMRTFRTRRDELVGRARGKYVLIKGEDVIDVFEDQIDAVARGFRTFGKQPFLVRQITEHDSPLSFASYNVGA